MDAGHLADLRGLVKAQSDQLQAAAMEADCIEAMERLIDAARAYRDALEAHLPSEQLQAVAMAAAAQTALWGCLTDDAPEGQ